MIFQLYLLRLDVIESSTYLHIQKLVHALLYHSSVLGFFFFNVDHFLKSLLNFLQYRFCFMFWFFGRRAYGILAPWPGIEPAPHALGGKVLITGPPGKPLEFCTWTWEDNRDVFEGTVALK